MEFPGRCGNWLDTDTVQGFRLLLDTTNQGWDLVWPSAGTYSWPPAGTLSWPWTID